jgi:hypothetical protein
MQTAYIINKGMDGLLDLCGPTVEFAMAIVRIAVLGGDSKTAYLIATKKGATLRPLTRMLCLLLRVTLAHG